MAKKKKKNNKKRKQTKKKSISRFRYFANIIFIAIIAINVFSLPLKLLKKTSLLTIKIADIRKERKQKEAIQKCLNSKEVPDGVKAQLTDLEKELSSYLEKYNVSFKYEEENLEYGLSRNPDYVYYGASLIKLVDADYLLDKDIDLKETKKYEKKYRMGYSSEVSKYKYASEISLGDLLKYAISVSDNSAHLMLIDYIGFNNLQEYGKSLGGTAILEGGDLFGNQTANDIFIYLKKAYELINNNENGQLLKDAMLNTEVNYLNFDDVVFGHKYGSYNSYFHDVGIYFSDDPYYIVVLSTMDRKKDVVTEISKKTYNIHNKLLELKTDYCNNLKI